VIVGGGQCLVTDELRRNTDDYNEVVRRAISRRFGSDALERVQDQAREQYRLKQDTGR
jgi:hypothetical protein